MPPAQPVQPSTGRPRAIVGIGASASGIDAIRRSLSALPADSGLGFVLVMHLRSDHPSQLAEVLQQGPRMPVVEARDDQAVAADTLYVIPPDRALSIRHGRLQLRKADQAGHSGQIDHFFQALAADQADRAIKELRWEETGVGQLPERSSGFGRDLPVSMRLFRTCVCTTGIRATLTEPRGRTEFRSYSAPVTSRARSRTTSPTCRC